MSNQDFDECHPQIILIVINDAFERNYISMLLQRFGYHVCPVSRPKEAMDFISGTAPALVITDDMLAYADNVDLLSAVRRAAGTKTIPALMISTASDPAVDDRYRKNGYRGIIRKPIAADALYRAVQQSIERFPRENIRISVYIKAIIESHPGVPVQFATVLSEKGMFIRTTTTLPPKSRLRVRLMFKDRTVNVEAGVLYSNSFDDYPRKEIGIGLSFIQISPEDREFIRNFIQQHLEKDIASVPGTKPDRIRN